MRKVICAPRAREANAGGAPMSRRRIDSGKLGQPEGQQDWGAAKERGDAVRAKVLELANLLRSRDPEATLTGEDLATFAGQVADESLTAIAGQVPDEDLTAIAGQIPDEDLTAIAGQIPDEDLAAIAVEYALDMPAVQSADVLASLPEVAVGDTRRTYGERLLKAVRR